MRLYLLPFLIIWILPLLADQLRCSLTSQGLYISCRDKTLVRRSSFLILSQGTVIYDSSKRKVTIRQEGNAYIWQDETPEVSLIYKASYVEEGVEVTLTIRLLKEIPASLQYFPAQMPVSIFAGALFRTDKKTGNIPLISRARSLEEATLAEDFHLLTLHTSLGEFSISLKKGEGKSSLLDARLPIWGKDELWLGYSDVPLNFGEEVTFSTLYRLDFTVMKEKTLTSSVGAVFKESLFRRNWALPLLPPPRVAIWGNDVFLLPSPVVLIDSSIASTDSRAVNVLLEVLKEKGHLAKIQNTREPLKHIQGNILLTKDSKAVEQVLGQEGNELLKEPLPSEGYIFIAKPSYLIIYGKDERGLFYGAQTLRWLLSDKGIRSCVIKDYPAFPLRGVHFFADKSAFQFYIQLTKKVLAPLKINTIILECEYGEWKNQPNLFNDWAMNQEEIRSLINIARENYIDVYPLIQSFGHAEWAFQRKNNLDIAEDPQRPYAFCPSNPRTYTFLFSIYEEVLRLFQNPRIVHIGGDEVEMIGRFPNPACPYGCGGKDSVTLYVQHIKKIYDYLSSKGCKVMIWGDELLAPGEAGDATHAQNKAEAEGRRKLLPKDIIIADWHYNIFSDYPSISVFKQAGFQNIVACTWYRAENIYRFALSAYRQGAMGLVETTWAGFYNTQPLSKNYEQVAPYVLSAIYSWNPDAPAPDSLPHMAELFKELWEGETKREKSGWLLDLSQAGVSIFEEIPSGERFLGGRQFFVPQKKVVLQAKNSFAFDAPNVVNLKLAQPLLVNELFFLHCAIGEEPPDTSIGEYEICYEDGGKEIITLSLGNNIMPLGSDKITISLSPPLSPRLPGLRILSWKNSYPQRRIAGVKINSYVTRSSVLLAGISATSFQ